MERNRHRTNRPGAKVNVAQKVPGFGEKVMENQSADEIRKAAMDFDAAVASKNIDRILASFTDNCEIEILGQTLDGKEGVEKWINWLHKNLKQIKFQPITILVDGNILFEEFIIRARLPGGIGVKSKQAEVLVYENYKIRSLRLYFDRLDFAGAVAKDPLSKTIASRIIKKSLSGLT